MLSKIFHWGQQARVFTSLAIPFTGATPRHSFKNYAVKMFTKSEIFILLHASPGRNLSLVSFLYPCAVNAMWPSSYIVARHNGREVRPKEMHCCLKNEYFCDIEKILSNILILSYSMKYKRCIYLQCTVGGHGNIVYIHLQNVITKKTFIR